MNMNICAVLPERFLFTYTKHGISQKVSEYDQEIPQLQTADQPTAL